MKAIGHRKMNLFLTILLCCALPVIILFSCKVQKVGPISPEPATPGQEAFQYISGQIKDYDLRTGIEGVSLTLGTVTSSTDANGVFSITTELPAGTYQFVASKENYLNIYREIEVVEDEDITLVFSFSMKDLNPPVDITAATGGTITVDQSEIPGDPTDIITVEIPAGALQTNTNVSITPIPLTTASQLNVVDAGYTPINSISLEPHGTTFTTAVQITVPNLLSPEALAGSIIVVKTIDPNTGIVSVRTEANPTLSADGRSITYSALHFSNDVISADSRYILSSTSVLHSVDGYPETFTNELDCRLDDCENDITPSTGYTGDITVSADFEDHTVNLSTNGGFDLEDVLASTGASSDDSVSVTTSKTVIRTTTGAPKVGIKTTVNFTRHNISIYDKTDNVTHSAGYILVPKSASVVVENLGTCPDHTGG